jgi:GT2 family glycosyltransferase
MSIYLITVAYNNLTPALLETALQDDLDLRLLLFTHSKSSGIAAAVNEAQSDWRITLFDYQSNRGLGRSWNEGIVRALAEDAEKIIIFNDDIKFSRGDIEKIVAVRVDDSCHIITTSGYHEYYESDAPSHGYSCFAITPTAIAMIGAFDENLCPAYFEDNDYDRRAALLGLKQYNLQTTGISHGGSKAIRNSQDLNKQNGWTFQLNQAYYVRKWGGGPHQEKYTNPFNNPNFNLHINFDASRSPYGPGFDRDLVALTNII